MCRSILCVVFHSVNQVNACLSKYTAKNCVISDLKFHISFINVYYAIQKYVHAFVRQRTINTNSTHRLLLLGNVKSLMCQNNEVEVSKFKCSGAQMYDVYLMFILRKWN